MTKTPLLAAAALSFGVTLVTLRHNEMRGFPDGHLTAFEVCLDPALALLPPTLGLGALALVLAALLPRHRLAAIVCAALPVLGALGHLFWSVRVTCHGLENGWGG